jgi:amidophosphoribosyltransferase
MQSDLIKLDSIEEHDDHPREACGVFGVYAPGRDVARITFFGLYALQHRGQESAGITTCDGRTAYTYKEMGLVSQVFNETNLNPLKGHLAIGHNRYSTTGSSNVRNAQPYLIETMYGPLGLAHNGNLTNALELRQLLLKRGVGLSTTTDSEVMVQLLAGQDESWASGYSANGRSERWEARIRAMMKKAQGAYSLTILTREAIYGVRDPYGLRPLCIGSLDDGGYVLASESCALSTVGARYVREVEPGEIVRIDQEGLASVEGHEPEKRALCSFEYVYFARPDSQMEGQVVHSVRQRMGRQLAIEAPVEADVVVPVPDSSTPAAIGYALQSGIPYTEGLIKNRYIGRTFIQPDNDLRKLGIHLKFNPLPENLKGKRVVLLDDSIVRGNTSGPLVRLIREGGATEVHVRVSSPPVRHPCFMGVDMATYKELIAHRMDIEGIREHIGADSLDYLSLSGMIAAIQETAGANSGHCTACFSGEYPVHIPRWLLSDDREKMMFEGVWGA